MAEGNFGHRSFCMSTTATTEYAFCRHVTVQSQGLNVGAVYNILTSSPCKKRPDTGEECPLINEDKNSKECLKCKLLGNTEQNFLYTNTRVSRKQSCIFHDCTNMTKSESQLCPHHKELVRRREKRWRETHDTNPPNSFLYRRIVKRKDWGICSMEECTKTADRTIKGFGEFCKSHSQTAWNRIHRAKGEISIQDVCKVPDKSKARIKKKVQDEHYNNKSR